MQKNDGAWVRKVLAGDQSAYENLVETHKGRVFAQVVGRIGNFSAAEDVVQNAFVEAYVHLKSLKSPDKFGGWLRGIAVNLSNKWLQRQRPSVPIETVEDEVSEGKVIALPDEVFETGEMKDTVLKAVEGLSDIYREVVLLHYMEGMTYPEIAAFLDVPESTVTGRLQVARKRLKEDLMPLVEETLQEKKPTSHLTRKVMSVLPPLLYVAAPAQATLIAKLKGSAMVKMVGFLTAGVIGTGVYFGGIQELIDWRAEEDVATEEIQFEFSETQTDLAKAVLAAAGQVGGSSSASETGSSKNKKEDAPGYIRIKGKAEDPVVSFIYTVPESSHVELRVLDGVGGVISTPVFESQKVGRHSVVFDKSHLPDGMYLTHLRFDHKNAQDRVYYKFYNSLDKKKTFTTGNEVNTRNWALDAAIKDSRADSLSVHHAIDSLLAVYDHSSAHESIAHSIYQSGRFLSTGVYHANQALHKYRDRPPQYRTGARFQALGILGKLQFKQGKYNEAKKTLNEALEVYQEIPAYSDLVNNRWDKSLREALEKIEERQDKTTVQENALLEYVRSVKENKSGDGKKTKKVEKAKLRLKTSPQDSLVEIAYSIPESVVPDSAMIEVNIYTIAGDLVARPVRSFHKAGNHVVYQSKRELTDGHYFVAIVADGNRGDTRKLKLVWEDRK